MTSIHSSPGGSPWDESLGLIDHSGAPHMGLSAFMVSFVMLTSWVLLQMCTVVLLDSFTKASLLIEHEEEAASYTKRSTEARPPAPHANPYQRGQGAGLGGSRLSWPWGAECVVQDLIALGGPAWSWGRDGGASVWSGPRKLMHVRD